MLRNLDSGGVPFPSFGDVGLNGAVYTLLRSGSLLYVGGAFTTVTDASGTVTRNRAACLDLSTALWTSWNPNAASVGACSVNGMAISADGASMYLAGSFDHIGGAAHVNIAKVDISTAAVSAWAPAGALSDIANGILCHPSNGLIYVGGKFKTVGATTRKWFAAFDDSTGALDAWNANLGGPAGGVYGLAPVLAASGDIYIGGGFTGQVGDPGDHFEYFARVDPTTGVGNAAWTSPIAFDAAGNAEADILKLDGSTLIVGRSFGFPASNHHRVANLTTGAASAFDLSLLPNNGTVDACSVNAITWDPTGGGSSPWYVGGVFDHVNGTARTNLCAVDQATGNPVAAWSTVAPNGEVKALLWYSGKVIVAGAFTTIAGSSRNRFAVVGKSGVLY